MPHLGLNLETLNTITQQNACLSSPAVTVCHLPLHFSESCSCSRLLSNPTGPSSENQTLGVLRSLESYAKMLQLIILKAHNTEMLFQTTGGSKTQPCHHQLHRHPYPCSQLTPFLAQPASKRMASSPWYYCFDTGHSWYELWLVKAHIPPGIRVLPSISYLEYQCFPLPLPNSLADHHSPNIQGHPPRFGSAFSPRKAFPYWSSFCPSSWILVKSLFL